VYDCHVVLSGPDADGLLRGRVTTLAGVEAAARSERELLTRLVQQFKQTLTQCREQGRPPPWTTETVKPGPGERQRWIPVHL